jgi:hypothetical protein
VAVLDPKNMDRRAEGSQIVGDPSLRDKSTLLEELAHQFQRGVLVSLGLDQHIKNLALRANDPATGCRKPLRRCDKAEVLPSHHLRDCSGCFRPERLPGGTYTHRKASPSHGARIKRSRLGRGNSRLAQPRVML